MHHNYVLLVRQDNLHQGIQFFMQLIFFMSVILYEKTLFQKIRLATVDQVRTATFEKNLYLQIQWFHWIIFFFQFITFSTENDKFWRNRSYDYQKNSYLKSWPILWFKKWVIFFFKLVISCQLRDENESIYKYMNL